MTIRKQRQAARRREHILEAMQSTSVARIFEDGFNGKKTEGKRMIVRNADGTFAEGNPGGPGRSKVIEYQTVFRESVSEDDAREIIQTAIVQAKRGDHRARSWLFDYLVSKMPIRSTIQQDPKQVWPMVTLETGEQVPAFDLLDHMRRNFDYANYDDRPHKPAIGSPEDYAD